MASPFTSDWLTGFVTTASWAARVENWLQGRSQQPFVAANREAITRCLKHEESGLRMVVNIPADALIEFLTQGTYSNVYEQPVVAGKIRKPSAARQRIDSLLGFRNPRNFFYGAAAMGGTGIRFYGEYCMVLKPDRVDKRTQILDRNSYDFLFPPLKDAPDVDAVVRARRGELDADAVDMLVLKVLPALEDSDRLLTLGAVSDAILHDEDFVEIHKKGTFGPDDLEEIRETPEDQAIHSHVVEYLEEGGVPTMEEFVWVHRRVRLAAALRARGIRTRVVSSAGRGSRWD